MNRPALIFDFGNVVAFFDYTRAADALGRPLGIGGAELLAQLRAAGFADRLRDYESGRVDSRAFAKGIAELAGLRAGYEEFAAAWADIFTLNEPVARLVAGLKAAGYTLVLGSNTNELQAVKFREQFAEALAPFGRLVLSFEVGHVKPAREFYLACAEAAGAPPADCVFIDDLPENVEGARAAGLRALLFRDARGLRADLLALGVSPRD